MYTGKMMDGDIPYGVGVLVAKDGGFLCGVRNDSGMIGGPGGFIKDGESPFDAATRETREEFGIEPKGLVKLGALKNNKDLYVPTVVFLCIDYDGEPKCGDGEMSFPHFCSLDDLWDKEIKKFPAFEDSLQLLQDMLDANVEEQDQPKAEPEPEQPQEASDNPAHKRDPRLASPLDKGQEKLKKKFGGAKEIALEYEPKFPHDAELSYKNAVGEYLESMNEVLNEEMQKIINAYENDNPQERQDSMFGEFGDKIDKFVKAVATAAGIIITDKIVKKLRKIAEKVRKNSVREWADSIGEALDIEIDESYYDEDYFADLVDEWEENNIEYVEGTTGKMIDDMAGDFMDLFVAGTAVTVLTSQLDRRKQQALNHLSFIASDQISKLDAAMRQMEIVNAMSNKYIWRTRLDDKVRPRHRELEGVICSYDDPPTMDSGEQCNPGEDYGCRCYAEPIFDIYSLLLPINGFTGDSFFPGELEFVKGEKDVKDGGPGSGNWGHAGRPGHEGGSASGGGKAFRLQKPDGGYTGLVWAYRSNEALNRGGKEALIKAVNQPPETFSGKAEPRKMKAEVVDVKDFPDAFSKGKKNKENTQQIVDFINSCEDADPAVVSLYKKMGEKLNDDGNDIPLKVSHIGGSCFLRPTKNGDGSLSEMKIQTPWLDSEAGIGAKITTLHEYGHMIDFLCRKDKNETLPLSRSSEAGNKLTEAIKKYSISGYDDIPPKCKAILDDGIKLTKTIKNAVNDELKDERSKLEQKYFGHTGVTMKDMFGPKYKDFQKESKKLSKEYNTILDTRLRDGLDGVSALSDIFDALSGGEIKSSERFGHGVSYYSISGKKNSEIVANYFALSIARPDIVKTLNAEVPELGEALQNLIAEMGS